MQTRSRRRSGAPGRASDASTTPNTAHRPLRARLHVVLLAQNDVQRQRSPVAERRCTQHGIPHEQREPGTEDRPEEPRILLNGIEEAECSETQYEGRRQAKSVAASYAGRALKIIDISRS